MTWNDTVRAHPHLSPTDHQPPTSRGGRGMESQTVETLLAHPDLNDRAKVVLVVLSRRGPASTAQIAQAAGHHLRKAQLALRDLIQQGLVEAHQHRRQIRYRLQEECGQLLAECGKSATNLSLCERSFADHPKFRERSFANPPSANAHARTSQSSSSEEDQKEYPVPSPSGGDVGGDNPVIHIPSLVQLKEAWRPLAPGAVNYPEGWLHKLYREFGLEIPLTVFRQFALSERTVQDLKHPGNYKSYFTRCCYTEQEKRQATVPPGSEDLVEAAADLLQGKRRRGTGPARPAPIAGGDHQRPRRLVRLQPRS